MRGKDLNNNTDYNCDYNLLFSIHILRKKAKRALDIEKVKLTLLNGICVGNTKPPKVCKKLYFGKENLTYFVVFARTKTKTMVITAWKKKGN